MDPIAFPFVACLWLHVLGGHASDIPIFTPESQFPLENGNYASIEEPSQETVSKVHQDKDMKWCRVESQPRERGAEFNRTGYNLSGSINQATSLAFVGICSILLLWAVSILVRIGVKCCINYFTVSVQLTGTMSVSVSNNDKVYHSLMRWLGKYTKGGHTHKIGIKIVTKKSTIKLEESDSDDDDFRPLPDYDYTLRHIPNIGYGKNYVTYDGAWFRVHRRLVEPASRLYSSSQELLTITTFSWNATLIQKMLGLAKPKQIKKDATKIVIYKAVVEKGRWDPMGGAKKKRPLQTLVLDGPVLSRIMADVHSFLDMETWYLERGIPYRRGYLLYGPPGCGKSSIVKSIAGELGYNICMFSLSQNLTDNTLTELFNTAPAKSIILLEDVDAAFKSRENEEASARETNLAFEGCSQSSLTFMGLLNALDGVASADDGQLVFMTTNYPERLDPALIRPGRVDLKIPVDYPSDAQIVGMFKKFFPEVDAELGKEFLEVMKRSDLKGQRVSMAMLQGLLVVYRDDPKEAVAKAEEHFKEQFGNSRFSREKCSFLYS